MSAAPGPVIAIAALVLVAIALLSAGIYAWLGKPSTQEGKQRKQHVVHGFQLGGRIVLGIILMGTLVTCSQIAFGIVESGRLSRIGAFLIAAGSLALIFSMIRHWAKHFAGWVGYGVWSGLRMATTGHLVNSPSISVPRWWSISATVLFLAGALACVRFAKNYQLNSIDKAALMTWLLAFVFAVDVESSTHAFYHEPLGLGAMGVGTLALVAAWWYHRATRHHHRRFIEPMQQGSAEQSHS